MEAIKDTIKSIMQVLEAKKKNLAFDEPEKLLKKLLAKKEYPHIKFLYLKRGILSIYVDSSSWLYHLNLKKPALLAKLTKTISSIKDIRFRLGETK